MQVEAKAPGEMPKPFYLQRRCAGVIASLAWSVWECSSISTFRALIKNQPVAGRVIDFFSYSRSRPIFSSRSFSRFFAHSHKRNDF